MELNKTEELVAEIKKGNMVLLMDDEDRENEGDLILAGEMVTPEKINFLAKNARGLICLALSQERCEALNLNQMVTDNKSGHGTGFTISIEAASGITTGISAADRARTVKVASKTRAKAKDIVSPGHIFPVKAIPGGVLSRAGHTEGSTDLCRLAGLNESAVICEVMNEDGTMARKKGLIEFSKKYNLKIGTIADLINYRIINEQTVEKIEQKIVNTEFGKFTLMLYKDLISGEIHVVYKKGRISKSKPVLVRVQQTNVMHDLLRVNEYGTRWSLGDAMKKVNKEGSGLIIVIDGGKTNDEVTREVEDLKTPYKKSATGIDVRRIGAGSQILRDLGAKKIKLMGSQTRYPSISGFGLEVTKYIQNEKK
ncbi:MAG: 3,4-dihydroxy-2-butanone-4-phosphate synthase [Flavobacteriaceae bacterium]|jgi:3,4-dihydroxy 2-butanone 4-phosphate synthase/GTP cyclohydrolase II|nr:3,4-dihydroxy-2-butanone-4-phosphate synthase [Flavobacteriaceae bacterium]|tara:strand:+ start:1459 stop:2562 length:1104 start_codon:yes stop_codon:yes gene_type:complete